MDRAPHISAHSHHILAMHPARPAANLPAPAIRLTSQRTTVMQHTEQGAPQRLYAYSVREFDGADGKKGRAWTRIGVAFPHKDGTGFNVEVHSFPLDGRIVLLPPDESSDAGESSSSNGTRDDRSGNGNGNQRRR
jgi:hypothetical protein